jgi:RNA-directed DNA polymerase
VKTYDNLYQHVAAFENLHLAYRRSAKGKRGQPNVAAFEFDLEANLLQLQAELRDKSYRPGPYYSFRIYDPKPRLISAAPFRDRVVHHAPRFGSAPSPTRRPGSGRSGCGSWLGILSCNRCN